MEDGIIFYKFVWQEFSLSKYVAYGIIILGTKSYYLFFTDINYAFYCLFVGVYPLKVFYAILFRRLLLLFCETVRFNLVSFYFERLKVYLTQLVALSIENPFFLFLSKTISSCLLFSNTIILLISWVTIFSNSKFSNFKF